MPYSTESLAKAIRSAYLAELYQHKSSYPAIEVQQNLAGRTHYADAGTLKYFSARILTAHILDDGLILGFVESIAHPSLGRVYRPVFFDLFGTVVERCEIEDGFKTGAAARKAFWKRADELDAVAITLAALADRADRKARELDGMREILAA